MSNLDKVQKIGKIFKILAIIAFVASIVMASLSAIAVLVVGAWGNNEKLVEMFIEIGEEYNQSEVLCIAINATIQSGFYIAISVLAKNLFAKQLALGTPFDHGFAKETRRVAIIDMILAVSSWLVTGIVLLCFKNVTDYMYEFYGLGTGLALFIVSYVLAYGADLNNKSVVVAEANNADIEAQQQAKEEKKED